MSDRFTGTIDPARSWFTIVPDNDADLEPRVKALWINEACTIDLMGEDGETESFIVESAGPIDLAPRRVMTSSTASAGAIKGLWG